jgi:hypothetical protein
MSLNCKINDELAMNLGVILFVERKKYHFITHWGQSWSLNLLGSVLILKDTRIHRTEYQGYEEVRLKGRMGNYTVLICNELEMIKIHAFQIRWAVTTWLNSQVI